MRVFITGSSGFIGTTVHEHFERLGWTILNYDIKAPNVAAQVKDWMKGDMRDREQLIAAVEGFKPDYIINLAAMTGAHLSSLPEGFFDANTKGVGYLIEAIRKVGTVKRTIFVSSLLVCENGYIPKSDTDYCAPNAYGQSKVEGEKIVRAADGTFGQWVIVRPTSVWGPWFMDSYKTFFQLIARNLFFNISKTRDLVKPITFAGNMAFDLEKLLLAPDEKVVGQTFYLCDYPEVTTHIWAEAVRAELGKRPIPTLPYPVVWFGAKVGDVLKALGWKSVPLSTFRLTNMTSGGSYPHEKLRAIVGELPYTLADGVKLTVAWMRSQRVL